MNPEENNQQSASTTVGGVTFGGGTGSAEPAQNTTSGSQMPNMPQAGQADVDPIVASTGEEFDAVMNGAQLPNSSAMKTPVASPTHFDGQNTVKPIVVDPGTPGGFSRQQLQAPEATPEEAEKKSLVRQVKKASTLSVIFGILTAVFTILAVVGLVYALNSQKTITDLQTDLDKEKAIITAVEEATGVAPIDSPDKVPVYKATTGYIYISEWNSEKEQENSLIGKLSLVHEAENYLESENGTKPTIGELAAFTKLSEEELKMLKDFINK